MNRQNPLIFFSFLIPLFISSSLAFAEQDRVEPLIKAIDDTVKNVGQDAATHHPARRSKSVKVSTKKSKSLALKYSSNISLVAQDRLEKLAVNLDKTAENYGRDAAFEKLSHKFQPFILSHQLVESLMKSVQTGRAITVVNPATGADEKFKPATKSMSMANAYLALSLAKMSLAQYGISQPSLSQLNGVLNGGTFQQSQSTGLHSIRMAGVLKQRAKGGSWEAVAKTVGVDPEVLLYDLQAANVALVNHKVTPSYAAIKAFPEESEDLYDSQDPSPSRPQVAIKNARSNEENRRGNLYEVGVVTAAGGSH